MNAVLKAEGNKAKPAKLSYSFSEAAIATSLSRRTLEYLIKSGKLKAFKIGRRTVIPARALERLVNGE